MKKFTLFVALVLALFYGVKNLIISGKFERFFERNKEIKLIENIQYRIGVAYYVKSEYGKAITHYQKFRKLYPKSKYDEDVDFYVASSYEESIKRQEAARLFEEFLKKYPNSVRVKIVENKVLYLRN